MRPVQSSCHCCWTARQAMLLAGMLLWLANPCWNAGLTSAVQCMLIIQRA